MAGKPECLYLKNWAPTQFVLLNTVLVVFVVPSFGDNLNPAILNNFTLLFPSLMFYGDNGAGTTIVD